MNVLITGASRGLGRVLARRFWEADDSLILVARRSASLDETIAALPAREGRVAMCIAADLSDPAAVSDVTAQLDARGIHVDVLVNNAAIQGPIGPLWENDWEGWCRTIRVNLLAPAELCRTFVPRMKAAGGGAVINLSGGGATGPRPNFSAYGTAKAALVRFSETLAEEVRSSGVRVNCIAPGAMPTAMLVEVIEKGASAAGEKEFAVATNVIEKGGASMDAVADLVLFLASERACGITGKLISAVWDPWETFPAHREVLEKSDIYTLRRIVPKDRGLGWGERP